MRSFKYLFFSQAIKIRCGHQDTVWPSRYGVAIKIWCGHQDTVWLVCRVGAAMRGMELNPQHHWPRYEKVLAHNDGML